MKKITTVDKQNKSDITKTDGDNQQESFINDQIIKDSKHEQSKSITKDSKELAAKRSKKTTALPKEDKTEVMDNKKKGAARNGQMPLPSSPKRK